MNSQAHTQGFAIAHPDDVKDFYEGSDVPGEFRRLGDALGCEQLAVTLVRVPPHSDFEQGTGHFHDEIEELYLLTRGTLTMRFGDEVETVTAPAAIRVDAKTPRSHRNEGGEPVEMWAISRKDERENGTKIDDFWEASPDAKQSTQ
ncbi:MAG: cupin domain-containing protein [Solirubrobacterales bacterium]|nr:cupin domain-containing protein [Solirubrobacterales bacterium]